jgi:hypothetical protein
MLKIIRSQETKQIAVVTGSKQNKRGSSEQYMMSSQQADKEKRGVHERPVKGNK